MRLPARAFPFFRRCALIVTAGLVCALSFQRALANSAPYPPFSPDPPDGGTHIYTEHLFEWYASDPDGDTMVWDIYFGTDPAPPLALANRPFRNFRPYFGQQPLAYNTTYYWRVVSRDSHGLETSGPVWSFTTKLQNEPPEPPYLPTPIPGQTELPVNPSLSWWGFDVDGGVANYDIYLGTNPDPPLVTDHFVQTFFMANPVPYSPPMLLNPATLYYWRVVARDVGNAETSSPVWSFTTANTSNRIPAILWAHQPVSQSDTATPLLMWSATDPDGEPLTFDVYLETSYPGSTLVGTTTEQQLQIGPLEINKRYYWHVVAKDAYWNAVGPSWEFSFGDTPVLISRFDARHNGDGVDVRWSLQSDESMQDYTLSRRESGSPFAAIANGPVQDNEGFYRDASVKAGSTYDYQLLIRTTDGNEFQSQVATIALPALTLTLHQNVPNPFNPQTSIRYDLPASGRVQLTIFDAAGHRVRTLVDEVQAAGSREAVWTGRDDKGHAVSSGVYFYVLDAGKTRLTRKLVLLK